DELDVCHYGLEIYTDRSLIRFEGPDETPLGLIVMSDQESLDDYYTDEKGIIPIEHQIIALDSVHIRTMYPESSKQFFQKLYNWEAYERDRKSTRLNSSN